MLVMDTTRRSFIKNCGALTLGAAGGALLSSCTLGANETKNIRPKSFPLLKPLTSDQSKLVESSYLANQDVKGYVKQGFGCGEIMMKAYIEKHQLSEDVLHSVVAFKNGFALRDTCCLYSTAIMIFGLSVKNLSDNRRERYRLCEAKIKRFRDWWKARSPMNCSDIFPACKNGYENQYKKVAYVVEEIAGD